MKTILPDGRVFETKEFISIQYNPEEPVYKYTFLTDDRKVQSSARHEWAVWNKETKDVDMIRMDTIDINQHELLIQGWED
jgi:hypothetical protein